MSPAGVIANIVAAAHITSFVFVVGGAVSIVVGAVKRWNWIRNPWFRLAMARVRVAWIRASSLFRNAPRLLFVLPAYSFQGPSCPETALNRIDTILFSHVPVCRPIRPFTPETPLDLLRAIH